VNCENEIHVCSWEKGNGTPICFFHGKIAPLGESGFARELDNRKRYIICANYPPRLRRDDGAGKEPRIVCFDGLIMYYHAAMFMFHWINLYSIKY